MGTQHSAAGTSSTACTSVTDKETAYDKILSECDLAAKFKMLGLDGDDLEWFLDVLIRDGSVLCQAGWKGHSTCRHCGVDELGLWLNMQDDDATQDETVVVGSQSGG